MITTKLRCLEVGMTDQPGVGLRHTAKFFTPGEMSQLPGEIFALGVLELSFAGDRHFTPGLMYYLDIHPVDPVPLGGDDLGDVRQGHPDGSIDPDKSL